MTADVELRRPTRAQTDAMLDDVLDVYRDAYNDPLYDGPLWSTEAFMERTRAQLSRDSFAMVTARIDGRLVGLSFGYVLEPGRWWKAAVDPPPDEVLHARKFAVIELLVRCDRHRQGIGRALLSEVLGDRPEPYAVLSSLPGSPARAIYAHWGWRQVGETHHPGGTTLHALAIDIGTANQIGSRHRGP